MFIAHLHQRLRLYTIEWMNLNVVVHPHVMHLVRDVQLRLLRQKSSIKSTILFWLIDEWKCASLLRSQAYHMAQWFQFWTIKHGKVIGKMGTAFAHCGPCHKRDRVMISRQCLEMFQHNPDEFLRRFITVDETWIHYFTTPETKEQSKQWTSLGEPAPKKAKTVKSAGKVMITVFWDVRDIIHVDYFLSKQTIKNDYYAALLDVQQHFKEKNVPIWRRRKRSSIKTMHGFIHVRHRWPNSTNSATNCFLIRYELLPHSLDLVPCDYLLFPNLKK